MCTSIRKQPPVSLAAAVLAGWGNLFGVKPYN